MRWGGSGGQDEAVAAGPDPLLLGLPAASVRLCRPYRNPSPFLQTMGYPVSVRAGSTVTQAVCGDSAGLVEWPRKVRKLSSFHTPSHHLCFLCLFFVFNLKESRLPAVQNTRELSEKLVPVSPKQVSPVCARGF